MKSRDLFFILIGSIISIAVSCGNTNAETYGAFRKVEMFGYICITNDAALWCER